MASQIRRGCVKWMAVRQHFPRKLTLTKDWPGVPDGILADVSPLPGRTYTRATWPPRGRGRGESLTSPRRVAAHARVPVILAMRREGKTWPTIARVLGYADSSGPWRLVRRTFDRIDRQADFWREIEREINHYRTILLDADQEQEEHGETMIHDQTTD